MKKSISNSEKWSQRIGYALTVLVLIDSIVPFAWNGWARRPVRHEPTEYRSKLLDALGKLADGKKTWADNEFGLEGGVEEFESFKNGFQLENGLGKVVAGDEIFERNITVFILPDLRRTGTTGNDNLAAVASNQELSLEDSDAIDFYWRQDIDAEKGLYPALWSPDLQYERDVQLVTEKTLLQQGFPDREANFRSFTEPGDFLRDLLSAQKECFSLHTPTSGEPGNSKTETRRLEKAPLLFNSDLPYDDGQPTSADNAYGGQSSNVSLALDWLNSTTVDPLNDVFLDPDDIPAGRRDQGQPSAEYNFLDGQSSDLNTPPVSMDWESKPVGDVTDENRADPMLFGGLAGEFDSMPTPDLQLAPHDVACLFADQQVAQDVAEAQTTKDMILRESPFAPVDVFPSTSGAADVVQFMPALYDENYPIGSEQSEVVIETFPTAYNETLSVPAALWVRPSSVHATWEPQSTSSSLPNVSATSTRSTWTGDHDYVVETSSSADTASSGDDWFTETEYLLKTEPDSYDGSSDDGDKEFSSEEQARAASERDELRAREMNLPVTAAEIVTMSQTDYVVLTRAKGRLTREQIELIKEIRRHGGNKEAARRSRQRKVQMTKKLEDEVSQLERERNLAMAEYRKLLKDIELEEKTIHDLKKRGGGGRN